MFDCKNVLNCSKSGRCIAKVRLAVKPMPNSGSAGIMSFENILKQGFGGSCRPLCFESTNQDVLEKIFLGSAGWLVDWLDFA